MRDDSHFTIKRLYNMGEKYSRVYENRLGGETDNLKMKLTIYK